MLNKIIHNLFTLTPLHHFSVHCLVPLMSIT